MRILSNEFIEEITYMKKNREKAYGCYTTYSISPLHTLSKFSIDSFINGKTKFGIASIDDVSIVLSELEGFDLEIISTEEINLNDIENIKIKDKLLGDRIIKILTFEKKYRFNMPKKTRIFDNAELRECFIDKLKFELNKNRIYLL
ncbi:MAG: hypothetical protein FWC47_17265 [Oscillospiraceae bacterium]|nr:hypothetical protein [Oscillospiraceae bacterium]